MNLIISVAGLVLCMLGLVQAWAGRQMEENTRRYFIAFFTILTAYVGSNLMGQLAEGYQGAGWVFATQLFIFLESAFSSLLMLLLSGFLLYSGGEKDWKNTRLFGCSMALAVWLLDGSVDHLHGPVNLHPVFRNDLLHRCRECLSQGAVVSRPLSSAGAYHGSQSDGTIPQEEKAVCQTEACLYGLSAAPDGMYADPDAVLRAFCDRARDLYRRIFYVYLYPDGSDGAVLQAGGRKCKTESGYTDRADQAAFYLQQPRGDPFLSG